MRANRRNAKAEVQKRSRSTKEDGDHQGIGQPAEGIRLPVPSYAEDDQASFLGQDEPIVPPDLEGKPAPQPDLPTTTADEPVSASQ